MCALPSVSVPVLSNTIAVILPVFSSAVAFLKRTPSLAALPLPAIMATGVARPNAHGQLITSTETACVSEVPIVWVMISQTIRTIKESPITAGTKTPATLSAILAIGALVRETFLTSSIILPSVVSSPT